MKPSCGMASKESPAHSRVGVTGAHGFLGKQIVRELLDRHQTVCCMVRNKRTAPDLLRDVETVEVGDLFVMEPSSLQRALRGVDVLVHAAWYAEPGFYLQSEKNLECLEGTLRLASVFARGGGKKFVGLGSCAEYAPSDQPLSTRSALKPENLYGACKLSVFQILENYLPARKVDFAWCRLFYLTGEGEKERRLIPYIRKQLSMGEKVSLTEGQQVRDFMDVQSAAKQIVDIALGKICGAVNVCSGEPVTIRAMAERVADEYGRRDLLRFGERPSNAFDPPYVVGVPSLLKDKMLEL